MATRDPDRMGLPLRVFLYTIDQICTMTSIPEKSLRDDYLYYNGRSLGPRPHHLMLATNVAPPKTKPDWRVSEREFVRWLRFKGFRVYDRSSTM